MPGRISFARFIDDWQLVNDALKPLLEQYPHLSEEQAQMEKLIADARMLSTEQERLRAQLQGTTRRRRESEELGQKLRGRILAQVKGKLGFESELLLEFGIAPRRKRVVTKKKGKPIVPATPPAPTPQ